MHVSSTSSIIVSSITSTFDLRCLLLKMESLLCDEVWLMSPHAEQNAAFHVESSSFSTTEDFEEAFAVLLGREIRFLPQVGYLKMIQNDDLIRNARFKAVNWIIKTQRRMDLSVEIVYLAVNYFDRFVSLNQCQGWKCWMFEALSIACLSVAFKFNETTPHLLNQLQIEDPECSFSSSQIQQTELKLLKALDWRMDATTPFSYIDLVIASDKTLTQDLSKRVMHLLLSALLDPKFLEFKQCVLAMAAFKCVLEDHICPSFFVIPQEQKDDLMKCQIMMEKLLDQDDNITGCGRSWHNPSSPVTVLFHDFPVEGDHSPAKTEAMNEDLGSSRKRKRELENGV